MIRVLIADDHAVVRRGVAQILAESTEIMVAGEAATGRQVLQALRENRYDLLVLDIAMPEGGGIAILAQILAMESPPRILILSMYPEKQYALKAIQAGAAGYLTKESVADELLNAVMTIAKGKRYITPALAEALIDRLDGDLRKPEYENLSNREIQVLRLLAAGKSVTQIAEELSLSVNTISTYRSRLLLKLSLENTAELIRYAVDNGLIM